MSRSLQLSIDSEAAVTRAERSGPYLDRADDRGSSPHHLDEGASLKAARDSLKRQIARLECELGDAVFKAFPYEQAAAPAGGRAATARATGTHAGKSRSGGTRAAGASDLRDAGPRLLGLAELERERDMLVARVSEAKARLAERGMREAAAQRLLAAMKLDPGRYKFVRLRAADLGEQGCGVWQVRPRLGLIGMLAGWWQVKLSSGCPLPSGCAEAQPQHRH